MTQWKHLRTHIFIYNLNWRKLVAKDDEDKCCSVLIYHLHHSIKCDIHDCFQLENHLPIIRETNEIGECEDQDGNIDSFKYKDERITTNCYEVSTNVEKLKMCKKKRLKNIAAKLVLLV